MGQARRHPCRRSAAARAVAWRLLAGGLVTTRPVGRWRLGEVPGRRGTATRLRGIAKWSSVLVEPLRIHLPL